MINFEMNISKKTSSQHWEDSCTNTECTLHQLSPFIGKLKSSIAKDLILTYSTIGGLVLDPFSGSGTIALEAKLSNRQVLASDINHYSKVLSLAKLSAPANVDVALKKANRIFKTMEITPDPKLNKVPEWVKTFFHPNTLKEAIKFSEICKKKREYFLLASFLGILHHQRPGFLSFPSSHLVPYLRNRKYPRSKFPELYNYRELKPRMLSKILRTYKRIPQEIKTSFWQFRLSKIENLTFPKTVDSIITSPPYMNALDYQRDNRLRLWFVSPGGDKSINDSSTNNLVGFKNAIVALAKKTEACLKRKGFCVLIVGEKLYRSNTLHPSKIVTTIFDHYAPSLKMDLIIADKIPDVRRSRRECRGVKTENVLIFRRK